MSAPAGKGRNDLRVETKGEGNEPGKQTKDRNVGSPGGHRKSLSGGLSQFSFFRSSSSSEHGGHGSKSTPPTSPIKRDFAPPSSPRAGPAMAVAVQQKSMRKRKGSLRKTAILGTGKLRTDGREQRGSSGLENARSVDEDGGDGFATDSATLSAPLRPVSPVDMPTPRPSAVPPPVPMVTHPVHGDPSKISASTTESQSLARNLPFPTNNLQGTAQSTASTTSDDESPTSTHPPLPPSITKDALRDITDSYFPPQPRVLPRPRPTTPKSRSPLATLPPAIPSSAAAAVASVQQVEWDYSETRWWGWLILFVTWIVFVVGMGSCFEVWSWAWDVGETPYAPPELNDDPTLPIVGYYPALMILTSVMAWVWVVVAWVGMKYFKHANISGEGD